MPGRVFALLLVILVQPAWLFAQRAEFRIDSRSAGVHKAPSVASPVIGQARRGDALEVTRDLGSWVKVSWPDADDGVGYVHMSTGTRTGGAAAMASTSTDPAGALVSRSEGSAASGDAAAPVVGSASVPTGYVVPPAHVVGLGGQYGGATIGAGMNARTWFHDRLGVQVEVSRTSRTGVAPADRLTATQLAPSIMYSFANLMNDHLLVRPYIGAGPRFVRQSASVAAQAPGVTVSRNSLGVQTFGGGEFTFASLSRFSISADARYGWIDDAAREFELDGLGFSLSLHWYVK